MRVLKIRGIKPLQEIIEDPNRNYGLKVTNHFPYEEFQLSKYWLFGEDAYKHFGVSKKFWQATYFERETRLRATPERWFIADGFSAVIEDGIAIGHSGMVVTPDGWLIKESTSMAGHWHDRRCIDIPLLLDHIKEINRDEINKLAGNAYLAVNPSSGFGHHLVESCIPLLLFLDEDLTHIVTTPGSNDSIVKQWLELFNFPSENFVSLAPTEYLQVKELSFFGHASHYFVRPEVVKILREKLLPVFSYEGTPDKRIYLNSRSSVRKNHAEEELEAFFIEQGFESIDPAELRFHEKMQTLTSAKTIAAVPGSAIWNILCFAPLESNIIYLENPAFMPSTYRIDAPVPPHNYVHIEPIFPHMYNFFGYRPMSNCIPNSGFAKNLTDVLSGKDTPHFPLKSIRIPLSLAKHTKQRKNIFDVDCDMESFSKLYNLMDLKD